MAESFYSQSLSSLSAWSRGLNPEVSGTEENISSPLHTGENNCILRHFEIGFTVRFFVVLSLENRVMLIFIKKHISSHFTYVKMSQKFDILPTV